MSAARRGVFVAILLTMWVSGAICGGGVARLVAHTGDASVPTITADGHVTRVDVPRELADGAEIVLCREDPPMLVCLISRGGVAGNIAIPFEGDETPQQDEEESSDEPKAQQI